MTYSFLSESRREGMDPSDKYWAFHANAVLFQSSSDCIESQDIGLWVRFLTVAALTEG